MIALLFVFLLAASGCGGGEPVGIELAASAPSNENVGAPSVSAAGASGDSAADSSAAGGARLDGYNVLLITIDTLRADRLGAYGYAGSETPNIDRLAAEGVRFERVTTTVPATLPAHASIMTGLQPFEHGVRNNGSFVLRDEVTTLAERFAAAGYATGGFIAAVVLDAQFGIAQGFERFGGLTRYQGETGDMSGERPGESVVDEAGAWIRGQTGPFFAWVHMYDPHDPYAAPEPYGSRYADSPYDGEVAYADAMVGRLRQALEESGAADSTLIVLTADHGEALGDHGEEGHSFFIYDSTIRVPLIFWAPGEAQGSATGAATGEAPGTATGEVQDPVRGAGQGLATGAALPERAVPAGAVVAGGVGVIDIFPTVLTLLGLPVPANSGVDLSRHFDDLEWAGRVIYSESLIPYLDFGWSELRALTDGDYKYIAAPEPELYDLAADPGETDNLVDADVERADTMDSVLMQFAAGDDVTAVVAGAVDPESIAALQALGYLSGGGGGRDRRDIDPKDMIETYETFVRGLLDSSAAIEEERFGDANEILLQLDGLLPDQYIVYYYFGQLAFQAGDAANAVGVFERALELNPSYLPTYTELANALYAVGDATAAQDLIAEALVMFPGSFSLTLLRGAFHHDSGQLDEALEAYRSAESLEPDHPRLLERLAHLHLLRQEPRRSADLLRRLSRITPDAAAVWAQLAFALAQIGEATEAQQALTRALEIDPNDPTVRQVAAQLR